MHLGEGLFIGDSLTLHEITKQLAARLGSSPENLPSPPFTHTVGRIEHIFAVFYLFFPSPLSVLPLQSLLQALAGLCGAVILRQIGVMGRSSWWGGLLVGWNPWCWEWSTQMHRDGFFVVGVLAVWAALLTGSAEKQPHRGICLGLLISGIILIFLARIYWLEIFKVLFLIFGLVGLLLRFISRTARIYPPALICFVGVFLCLVFQDLDRRWSTKAENASKETLRQAWEIENNATDDISKPASFESAHLTVPTPASTRPKIFPNWQKFPLPVLDYLGYRIYRIRQTQILVGGRSLMDENQNLESLSQQIFYIPRALQLALFAPFPSEIFTGLRDGRKSPDLMQVRTWPQAGLGFRSTHAAAKIAPYLGSLASLALLGMIGVLWCEKTRNGTILMMMFCLPPLLLLGEVMPNLGTLIRLRYAFWILLVALGAVGWAEITQKVRAKSPRQ